MLVMAIAIAGAFAATTRETIKTPVLYHYRPTSGNILDLTTASNWYVESTGCGDEGSIPCGIEFEGTRGEFDTYIESFTSVEQMNLVAVDKKD